MLRRIEFGSTVSGKPNAAFAAFVAPQARPYTEEQRMLYNIPTKITPVVLMINRHDGKLGFPGGTVEKGETLTESLIRECEEEINYRIYENELNPLSSYEISEWCIHLFTVNVDYVQLKHIMQNWHNAQHAYTEVFGLNVVHLKNHHNSFSNFLKNNFVKTARHELANLIKTYEFMSNDEMCSTFAKAGFNINEMSI